MCPSVFRQVVVRLASARYALLIGVLGLVLTSCQVKVDVATTVHDDGSGTVVVGVGLDDAALERTGNLSKQLRTEDLVAAGWRVDGPTERADGFTWIRASKDFTEPAQVGPIMDEITGPNGVFKDFELTRKTSWRSTEFHYAGVVDLTGGPEVFSDPQLAEALDGDPFGGTLKSIEEDEGRPASEMVSFTVSVDLPGTSAPAVWAPGFSDQQATTVELSSSKRSGMAGAWVVVVGVVAIVGALVIVRKAFLNRH